MAITGNMAITISCAHCDGKGMTAYHCCYDASGVLLNPFPYFIRKRIKSMQVRCCVCGGRGFNILEEDAPSFSEDSKPPDCYSGFGMCVVDEEMVCGVQYHYEQCPKRRAVTEK